MVIRGNMRALIKKARAGDFVNFTRYPVAGDCWGFRPGIILETRTTGTGYVTICPITSSSNNHGTERVSVGPQPSRDFKEGPWFRCSQFALKNFPAYINFAGSITLGRFSPSPDPADHDFNWFLPRTDKDGNIYEIPPEQVAPLKSLFCAFRCGGPSSSRPVWRDGAWCFLDEFGLVQKSVRVEASEFGPLMGSSDFGAGLAGLWKSSEDSTQWIPEDLVYYGPDPVEIEDESFPKNLSADELEEIDRKVYYGPD